MPDIYDPSAQLPNDIDPNAPLELSDKNHPLHYEADVIGHANFAKRTKEEKIRKKKLREEIKRKREQKKRDKEEARRKRKNHNKHMNSTLDDSVDTKSIKKRRNRRKGNGVHKHDRSTEIPLHPKTIVEDLSDWKLSHYNIFNESAKET